MLYSGLKAFSKNVWEFEGSGREALRSGGELEPGFNLDSNFSFLLLEFRLFEEFELFQSSEHSILNLASKPGFSLGPIQPGQPGFNLDLNLS